MDNSGLAQNIQKFEAERLSGRNGSETDLAMAAGAEGQGFDVRARMIPTELGTKVIQAGRNEAQLGQSEMLPGAMAREQAQQLGWQVLDGGQNKMTEGVEQRSAEIVDFEAAQEIARDQAELTHPEEFVGDETELQIDERLRDQQENSLNEINPGRDFEAEIAARSQERIAQTAMGEVEKLLKEKQVHPGKIVEIWRKRGDAVLNSYENPHPIGKGN